MLENPENLNYETVIRKDKLKVKMLMIGQSAGKAPKSINWWIWRIPRDHTPDSEPDSSEKIWSDLHGDMKNEVEILHRHTSFQEVRSYK